MSTKNGRKGNYAKNGFKDTVVRDSAEQGILITQDAMITQMNAMQTALAAFALAASTAADIAAVNAAATTLDAALNALPAIALLALQGA